MKHEQSGVINYSDTGRCAMLIFRDGQAYCLIESELGKAYKPEVCRLFPANPDECMCNPIDENQ